MSPLLQVPLLPHPPRDLDTDSDYLGTPVDPPANCHPYVADYEPLDYYYPPPSYDSHEYPGAHHSAHYGDSALVGATPQHGLLLQPNYPVTTPRDCNQSSDSPIAAYHLIPSDRLQTDVGSDVSLPRPSSNSSKSSPGPVGSFLPSRRPDTSSPQSSSGLSQRYSDYSEGEDPACLQKVTYSSVYSKPGFHPPELALNTSQSYDLTPPPQPAFTAVYSSSYAGNVVYGHRGYYDEPYADSPIEDPAYGDRYPDQGCSYEHAATAYDSYSQHPEPHADTHYTSGSLSRHQHVRFYQSPSCPYSYPRVDPAGEGSDYSSSPISRSSTAYVYPVIHAPRPQQLHDVYTLHSSTCPPNDSPSSLLPPHRILSIPSIPAPPPIPRPTSLIEDSPKKPLTLACFFCRKRKIACQSPPTNAPDRTCNQCAKRKLKCVYPATSRRGIRPRVYDLSDETFRRPSLPLAL